MGNTWADAPGYPTSKGPARKYRDPRVNRHRQSASYVRPRWHAQQNQLHLITNMLTLVCGQQTRPRRLATVAAILGRDVPALQALSVLDANRVLVTLYTIRSRYETGNTQWAGSEESDRP